MRPGKQNVVMEMGIDGPGQMRTMAQVVRPDVAVVTSIGTEHHRSLGTLETTRDEKAELVRVLSPAGHAVLNGDDPNVRWMAGETQAQVTLYGFDTENEIRARELELDWPRGMRFRLETPQESRTVNVRLIGRYMIYPILAAVAVARAEGIPLDKCLELMEDLPPTRDRMEARRLENGAILLCDYFKSSHETVVAALEVFGEIPAKRRLVVMGEVSEPPGSQGPIYRDIGERIARVASQAIFVGRNFQRYKAGATRGGMAADAVVDAGTNVLQAAEALPDDLGEGDVVLIKGRDTQRLDRVACALEGRQVGCQITFCQLHGFRCHRCPMLADGWGSDRATT
jgi:UDP-N-acetylmuramyl pentapeptide synthase